MYATVAQRLPADTYVEYPWRVTYGSAAAAESPNEAARLRNPAFAKYLGRKIAEARRKGITITQLAERGGIGRQSFNRWRGIGGPQTIPDAANLAEFCRANGWDAEEPMRILGWTDPAPDESDELHKVLAQVRAALDNPDLTAADAEQFTELLNYLARQLRLRAQRNATE